MSPNERGKIINAPLSNLTLSSTVSMLLFSPPINIELPRVHADHMTQIISKESLEMVLRVG